MYTHMIAAPSRNTNPKAQVWAWYIGSSRGPGRRRQQGQLRQFAQLRCLEAAFLWIYTLVYMYICMYICIDLYVYRKTNLESVFDVE